MSLNGKNALVTGGSRGIGRAVCIRLAAMGAHVYINYVSNPEAAEETRQAILAAGKKLLLPRMIEQDNEVGLEWVAWNGDPQNLKARGRILEPIGPAHLDLNQIAVVIVPALQVDGNGYRLGQGGGFYDRFLSQTKAACIKIGVCHTAEPITIQNIQNTDISLDFLISPNGIRQFSNIT